MKRLSLLLTSLIVCGAVRGHYNGPDTLADLTAKAYSCYLSKPDTAILLTEEALGIAQRTNNIYYQGYSFYLLSKAYWVKANYKLSTEYGFKALKIFQGTSYYSQLSSTWLVLGRNFVELGNIPKAREFINNTLKAGIENSDERLQASAYRELSYLLTEVNELDSGLYFVDKGLALFKKLGDSLDISVLYGRKSRIFFQQKRFTESRKYAYQGLEIDSLVGNRRGLGIAYFQVAQNEYILGNTSKALAQLRHSIRINSELGNLTWIIKAHELLATYYLESNQHALAAAALKKVSTLKDELYNSEKNGQVEEMRSLHELESKENTITQLERENDFRQQQVKGQRLFVVFLLVTVVLLVWLIIVLTRLRKIQNKTNRDLARQNSAIKEQKVAIQTQADNLQELDRVKTKLFSVISHDLRGPIANLQSLLDLFTKKLMTTEEFVQLSAKLKENLNITQRTLENLLTWSLSQMGGIRTEQNKLEVGDCIEESCSLMSEVAARKNISILREINRPMKVWADRNQLQVVLRNLIHNAIKFSSFNDTVRIRVTHDDARCHVMVKDSGIGMTRQEIEALVGSTQYVSRDGTKQEKGTGLGLLLCKEFISRNGGQIAIKSSLGEGTEVSFSLLLAEREGTTLAVQ